MDLASLQTFIAVMRQGSFAAVARDRNLDPSSISRTIANLEKELGTRLFQRSTRKLSPTEAGLNYFHRIESLVAELDQASHALGDRSGQPSGTLRVTASVSFGLKCIVPILPAFETQYPDLNLDLLLTDAVVDLLADRIDLAIRLGPLADSTLIAQPLMRTHYAICASPSYLQSHGTPASPKDIAQHNCLRFPLGGYRDRWRFRHQNGQVEEIPVSGRTVISSAIALRDCAIAGMGIALLALWLIADELENGSLVQILPQYDVAATDFETYAWLIYPSRQFVPLKVERFMEHLKSGIRPRS